MRKVALAPGGCTSLLNPAAPQAARERRDRMNSQWPAAPFKHLVPGHDYVVVRAFTDYDHGQHAEGERWTFIGSSFLPYDDGLSLFVTINGERRHIRMQWRDEEQGPVIDALREYVQAAR